MSRKFDRFMVDVNIASHPKLATFTPAERWCVVAGVFPLAALSPVRGRLLIGEHKANEQYVAHHSRVSRAVARSTLRKMRDVGMIVHDPDLDCDAVHDFGEWNPEPKHDPTNAERQARHKQRRRALSGNASNAQVTVACNASNGGVTLPEVEVEVKPPLTPPPSGGRQRQLLVWEKDTLDWARAIETDGPAEQVLRAVRQAKPWEADDPAAHFKAFFDQHFQGVA